MDGFSESNLVVLTNTLNEILSDYVGPNVELVVSPVTNAVAPTTQLTCQQLPTPDALTRSGDYGGHIQRVISRILRARSYLDLLVFLQSFPTGLYEGDFGYESRGFGSPFFRYTRVQFQDAIRLFCDGTAPGT
jgi:hypothetical protein